MENDEYITVAQAAALKGVADHTIRSAISSGKVEAKEAVPVMVNVASLEAWTPATYGGIQREKVRRGPGRPRKAAGE